MGKRRKPRNEPPVNEADFIEGEAGPLSYSLPMPPVKSRGRLVAGGKIELLGPGPETSPGDVLLSRANTPRDTRPLIPASEEVAKLPRGAREAFAARCAARVAVLRTGAASP